MEPHNRVIRVFSDTPEKYRGTLYWNATAIEFDGNVFVISRRAILTLVTIAGCNAACHFCSNEITFTNKGPYLAYDERIARVKELALLAGVTKVAFTGGEPTVAPQKLYDLVAAVVPGFARARLHTNGSGLFRDVRTPNGPMLLLDALIDAGLTGASISVAHHDPTTNRSIMRFKTSWRGLDDATLREIAARGGRGRFSPRLSCVLTHDGINRLDDILRYMEWGRSLGFKRFIFRSPSGIPGEFSKQTEFTLYNTDNHRDIHEFTEQLERRPGWREVYVQHKSDSHVHVYEVDGEVKVDIDESAEEADPDDKIRRLTVMPDGVAYTSWIDPYSNLFPEDADRAAASAARELPVLAAARMPERRLTLVR